MLSCWDRFNHGTGSRASPLSEPPVSPVFKVVSACASPAFFLSKSQDRSPIRDFMTDLIPIIYLVYIYILSMVVALAPAGH